MKKYPHLFSPLRVKDVILKNRIMSSPMQSPTTSLDGDPTETGIGLFAAKAAGGAAIVTLSETPVDGNYRRLPWGFRVDNPHSVLLMRMVTDAIKEHGGLASIQLNHAGCFGNPEKGCLPMGPSAFTREDGLTVREMTGEMMEEVAESFARAAGLVKAAGFDMCMINGGHGWLLHQFMSPLFNRRKDEYGGIVDNRARFPEMVLKRIRQRVGPQFLLEYRISGDERCAGGMTLQDVIEFVKRIEDKIDILHVSTGVHTVPRTNNYMFPLPFVPHGINADIAGAIRKEVKIPVAVVGGISHPAMAENIIREGKADIVAMCRQLIADPEFPNKALAGRDDEIVPCIRCMNCMDGMDTGEFACSVNPRAGREFRLRGMPAVTSRRRKVVVVGGGPGGLQAAITAAERGHDVTVFEKSRELGGILKLADSDPLKGDLKRYKDFLIRRVGALGIEVHLNTAATPALVGLLRPYAVVAALGSEPVTPRLPGIEGAVPALRVYGGARGVGDRVVMIGGGLAGCETGLYLAGLGRRVVIVEARDLLAADTTFMYREGIYQLLDELAGNIECRTNTACTRITSRGIRTEDLSGTVRLIDADTVVYAVGMQPKKEESEQFRDIPILFFPVGDCVRPRKVKNAVHDGYNAALSI